MATILSSKWIKPVTRVQIKQCLLSVYDKTDIVNLASTLANRGVDLLSTGGTRKMLLQNDLVVTEVAEYTNSQELLGGRVKTLHPRIYAGLLARRGDDHHMDECREAGIKMLDLVVVNLYPFSDAVNRVEKDRLEKDRVEKDRLENDRLENDRLESGSPEECVGLENIDIGGVSLIRATAKNYHDTVLLTSPSQYPEFIQRFMNDDLTLEYRSRLALEGFRTTSSYDRDISEWLAHDSLPLKYGLNPHQSEAWAMGLREAGLKVRSGLPGYINLLDAFQGFRLVSTIRSTLGITAACSMKHTSPAGVGIGREVYPDEVNPFFGMGEGSESGGIDERSPDESPDSELDRKSDESMCRAYARARNSDPRSSFGDFICVNGRVEKKFAKMVKSLVSDGIIADIHAPRFRYSWNLRRRTSPSLCRICSRMIVRMEGNQPGVSIDLRLGD